MNIIIPKFEINNLNTKGLKATTSPIKNLAFKNINFTSLSTDRFEKSPQEKKYSHDSFYCYVEVPFDGDNSYKLTYNRDCEEDLKNNNVAPCPPLKTNFKKPTNLSKLCDIANKYYYNCEDYNLYNSEQFNILKKFVSSTPEFKNEKATSIMDCFGNTIVIDLDGDRVLKMVKNNPFPNRNFNPKIDIPLLSKVHKFENYYIFVQEKADTDDIDSENVADVVDRIKQEGYTPYDIDDLVGDMQIGFSPSLEQYMLIDSECAQGKKEN